MEKIVGAHPVVTVCSVIYNIKESGRTTSFVQMLQSVQNQTYPNIEHLIIDGGSTDGTLQMLDEYALKGWITYISEPDTGIYDAMNKGIRQASGEYTIFLNSDDFYFQKEGIEKAVSALQNNEADYCFSDVRVTEKYVPKKIWIGTEKFIPIGKFYCHQSLIVKTAILRELNGFNTALAASADNDLMLRLISHHKKAIHLPFCFVSFELGGASASMNKEALEEQLDSFYTEFGKEFSLTKEDCNNLQKLEFTRNRSIQSDLQKKIGRNDWKELIASVNKNAKFDPFLSVEEYCGQKHKSVKKEACYPIKIFLCGIPVLILYRMEDKLTLKLLGIPLFHINNGENRFRLALFGVEIFKIKRGGI